MKMNDLLSKYRSSQTVDVEMAESDAPSARGVNLDRFFQDVETVKEDLREIEELLRKLKESHEESKIADTAQDVKDLRSKMDGDISLSLKKAKLIKVRLEALDRGNAANRKEPGCGPGSSADRTRTSVVNGLRKKLKEKMNEFQDLRQMISSAYREAVSRRYFTLTGENPDDKTLDTVISDGEIENFFQKAIQQQGREKVHDTISEIRERHGAVKDTEKNLEELQQLFSNTSESAQHQGQQVNDIEAQVQSAHSSFMSTGAEKLQAGRKTQNNTPLWICFGTLMVLIVILAILLALHPWKR